MSGRVQKKRRTDSRKHHLRRSRDAVRRVPRSSSAERCPAARYLDGCQEHHERRSMDMCIAAGG